MPFASRSQELRGSTFFMPADHLHGLRRPYMPTFEAEGGAGGGGGNANPAPAADDDDDDGIPAAPVRVRNKEQLREPTAYEVALREENKKWRVRAREAERRIETASGSDKAEWERKLSEARTAADQALAAEKAERERVLNEAKEASERAVAEARTAAERRIVKAEVRALAIQAGLQHAKGLDLLDLSEIKLDDKGELSLPEGYFDKAKEEFPFLFAAAQAAKQDDPPVDPAKPNSGNPANTPAPKQPTGKKVTDLSAEEYAAMKAQVFATGRLPS